ncbi:MAG: hypothetical protein KF747_15015 [Nitrospira sp.]|nr:hypothetical protein [Nitrospira sp.]
MEPKDQEEKRLPLQACLLICDGDCRFCVSVKMGLERRGVDQTTTGIRFVAYQSEAARIAVGQQYRPGRPEAAFFVQPSGKILQGPDAFSPLLPHLRGGTLVQWGLRFGTVQPIR